MDHRQFITKLQELEQRFDALTPELEMTVRDPELGVEGYVVVWTTLTAKDSPLGRCGKGGTRVTPRTSLEEIKMLARIMALKNAAAGLPLGGAKSGMKDDSQAAGFEQRLRRFARLASPTLIENGGIFGGFGFDIGVRPEHARWVCDELQSTRCFTGKPLDMGGTDYDREGIAGLGVSVGAATTLRFFGHNLEGSTFSVQGLGAMGGAVVRYYSEYGASLRAVSDPQVGGTYVIPHGASAELVASISIHNWDTTRSLLNKEGHLVGAEEVLYQAVDVLFPCAVQEVITGANVDKIVARFVVEGANNPCTAEARTALHTRGVKVIPDFIVNAGGIIAAYVEMSSSITPDENLKTKKNSEDAKALTRERIAANVHRALEIARDADVEPVLAAKYLALTNIFKN